MKGSPSIRLGRWLLHLLRTDYIVGTLGLDVIACLDTLTTVEVGLQLVAAIASISKFLWILLLHRTQMWL